MLIRSFSFFPDKNKDFNGTSNLYIVRINTEQAWVSGITFINNTQTELYRVIPSSTWTIRGESKQSPSPLVCTVNIVYTTKAVSTLVVFSVKSLV